MRKSFILLFGLSFLTACGYKSSFEAMYDCKAWANEAKTYKGVIKAIKKTPENEKFNEIYFKDTVNSFPIRKCELETETNQVLGLEVKNREADKVYILGQGQRLTKNLSKMVDIGLDWVVENRFRY